MDYKKAKHPDLKDTEIEYSDSCSRPALGSRIDELGSLRHALECIAGKSQWIDNTMSDKQIAKYVLWRLYHEKDRLSRLLSENDQDHTRNEGSEE